jgi:hypothetical protein
LGKYGVDDFRQVFLKVVSEPTAAKSLRRLINQEDPCTHPDLNQIPLDHDPGISAVHNFSFFFPGVLKYN